MCSEISGIHKSFPLLLPMFIDENHLDDPSFELPCFMGILKLIIGLFLTYLFFFLFFFKSFSNYICETHLTVFVRNQIVLLPWITIQCPLPLEQYADHDPNCALGDVEVGVVSWWMMIQFSVSLAIGEIHERDPQSQKLKTET